MLLLQFYDLNLFQNKTLWLKNRKEISFPSLSLEGRGQGRVSYLNKNLSSLVQRQSERQGIFFVALSPLERGAGGVKYQLYFN